MLGNVAHGRAPLTGFDASEELTLGGFIDVTYDPWARANRPTTAAYTLKRLKRCFSRFYNRPLSQFTAQLIEDWKIARLKEGLSNTTIVRDVASLSAVLTRAVKADKIADNPMRKVDKPRIDRRPKVRYLTTDEELRLRTALARRDSEGRAERTSANEWRRERRYELLPELPYFADHLTPAILVSMNTGLRRGELLGLQWSDVDLPGRLLMVRGESSKTGNMRYVPLMTRRSAPSSAGAHSASTRTASSTSAAASNPLGQRCLGVR